MPDPNQTANAWRAALLLTASPRGAEHAVTRAVEIGANPILAGTLAAALAWGGPAEPRSCVVPHTLDRVLVLPRALRHAYVLRILEGVPAGLCAALLHSSPAAVNSAAAEAAWLLASPVLPCGTAPFGLQAACS